jgi:group I intron endonuclease
MRKGIIYKVTNLINSKVYIGQTLKLLHKRRIAHLNSIKKYPEIALYKAIKKYGEENFEWVILEEVEESLLNEREIFYIKEYNSYNSGGYNMTTGGEGNPNLIYSESLREKRRLAAKKRWDNPNQREAARERGRKRSETKEFRDFSEKGVISSANNRRGVPMKESTKFNKSNKNTHHFIHSDGREFTGSLYNWRRENNFQRGAYNIKSQGSYKGWTIKSI